MKPKNSKENHLNYDAYRDQLKRLMAKKDWQYWLFYGKGFVVRDGGEEGQKVAKKYELYLKSAKDKDY